MTNNMDEDQFRQVQAPAPLDVSYIGVHELVNKRDRTLLYGYDCDRRTWHVYLKDGVIHLLVYLATNTPEGQDSRVYWFAANEYAYNLMWPVDWLVPNKRVYPELCDFEFCVLLKAKQTPVSYLPYGSSNPVAHPPGQKYAGLVYGESENLIGKEDAAQREGPG
jgi:hypothetical protein